MADEIEEKAKALGWSPKENFRGDPEKWIDAETYVKRGEELMPLLQANNKKLVGQLSEVKGELAETRTLLKAASESIDALKNFNTEQTRKAVREENVKLKAELKEARKAGDTDAQFELEEQLEANKAALSEAEKEPVVKTTAPTASPGSDPVFEEWVADNPWWSVDKRRTSIALGIAQELKADPQASKLQGRAFLDRVIEELDKTLGTATTAPTSKVEGSRHSADGGNGSKSKSYSDLPSDAKEVCEKDSIRLVGKGRAFATKEEWRKHYVQKYFEE